MPEQPADSEQSLGPESSVDDDAPVGDFVSIPEAAAILGINNATVRQAVLQGRLSHVRRFGRKLIPRTALEEYRARTQPPTGKARGRPKKRPDQAD